MTQSCLAGPRGGTNSGAANLESVGLLFRPSNNSAPAASQNANGRRRPAYFKVQTIGARLA
jgi:hypothetical protein